MPVPGRERNGQSTRRSGKVLASLPVADDGKQASVISKRSSFNPQTPAESAQARVRVCTLVLCVQGRNEGRSLTR